MTETIPQDGVTATKNPIASIAKTHLSLNVANVEHSVAFYEILFGQPAHKRRPGYANFDVQNPPLKLALEEQTVPGGVGKLSHLGIQVATPEEVAAHRARLAQHITFDEGDTVCCYSRQDKMWLTDPDGNGWEIYTLLDEMDDAHDHHFDEHGRMTVADGGECCATTVAATTLPMAADTGSACCGTGCGC